MKLITGIKYIECNGDIHQLHRMNPHELGATIFEDGSDPCQISAHETIEIVRGIKLRERWMGGTKSQTIGMTQEVQDILGMQYSYVSKMSIRSFHQENKIDSLIVKIQTMENASLWNRFKWVFTGIDRGNNTD